MSKQPKFTQDEMRELAKSFTIVRETFGLSRADVASAIFVCSATIGNAENGIPISKNMGHHLWLMYSDYLYDCTVNHDLEDPQITSIQDHLDIIGRVLYGKEY